MNNEIIIIHNDGSTKCLILETNDFSLLNDLKNILKKFKNIREVRI